MQAALSFFAFCIASLPILQLDWWQHTQCSVFCHLIQRLLVSMLKIANWDKFSTQFTYQPLKLNMVYSVNSHRLAMAPAVSIETPFHPPSQGFGSPTWLSDTIRADPLFWRYFLDISRQASRLYSTICKMARTSHSLSLSGKIMKRSGDPTSGLRPPRRVTHVPHPFIDRQAH